MIVDVLSCVERVRKRKLVIILNEHEENNEMFPVRVLLNATIIHFFLSTFTLMSEF